MHEFVRCTDHPIRGRPSGGGPANAYPCGAKSGSVMSKLKQEVSLSQDVPLPEQGTRFSMPGNSGDSRCRVQQRSPLLSDPLSDETRTCSCLISRGAFRGCLLYTSPSTGEDAPVHATPPPQPALDDLASQLQDLFWRPLQDALRWTSSQDSPCAVLHVCGHGPLHQLPLAALAAQFAQAQLQLVQWPGLPYFRIAATGTAQEGEAAPWQLGHDCAWQQDQPLPMVAVEAHLLGALLDGHGRRVQWLSQASELQAHCAALVACCHGQHAAHFDSALALGELPLAVESIVAERLGPRAVLLPVCHAGETAEDAAGNALGVACLLYTSRCV